MWVVVEWNEGQDREGSSLVLVGERVRRGGRVRWTRLALPFRKACVVCGIVELCPAKRVLKPPLVKRPYNICGALGAAALRRLKAVVQCMNMGLSNLNTG